MALTRATEVPTIDVSLITIETEETTPREYALDTANEVKVTPLIETQDGVRLMNKGRLISQKRETNTLVGHTLVITDNVFTPEVVHVLQGGTIDKDVSTGEITKYTPPVVGAIPNLPHFKTNCYSARYDAACIITGYEKVSYPHCLGTPIAMNSKDNVFRAPEYTINSAPNTGEAPYTIEYIDELPTISAPEGT